MSEPILGKIRIVHPLNDTQVYCYNIADDSTFELPYHVIPFYFNKLTPKQVELLYDRLENRVDVIVDTVTWKCYVPAGPGKKDLSFELPEATDLERAANEAVKLTQNVHELAADYMTAHQEVIPLGDPAYMRD